MKVTVLSDGAWGTSLALVLLRNGHDVHLWGPFPEYVLEMRRQRENARFLPGVPLPAELSLETDLAAATRDADLLLLAAPAQYARGLCRQLAACGAIGADALLVNVAKGIEVGSLKRMSELVAEVLGPRAYAVLSGPSYASEVARGVPTAVVAAAGEPAVAARVQQAFLNETFRVYTSADVIGVELGGALKNVLALAAGMCDGLGFGDNSKAALMTRGIVEMARLGKALGGRPETFFGLSGVGDLIVTCAGRHSRNRHVGQELGKGRALADVQAELGLAVAEGVPTAESAWRLAAAAGIDTPIINEVHATLYEGKNPRCAVRDLMSREAKPELPEDFLHG
jgi:glycerol-3-phosphate dehydrogenase (NAD(P)+)